MTHERATPSERFAELVRSPEPAIDLAAGALLVAEHAYPGLSAPAVLAELDRLASTVTDPTVDGLRRALWVDAGFAGNVVDYYDPRNSFLNDVLDRRTGIPITLAIVAIEVGRRAGVRLAGVGMPGHFLLGALDQQATWIDPFDGLVLDLQGAEELFARVTAGAAAFDVGFLEPVGPLAILSRMLANLKVVYGRRRDVLDLAWVLRLRLLLPGAPDEERVELSRALAAAGRYGEAADELDVLADAADDEDARVRSLALRARLN